MLFSFFSALPVADFKDRYEAARCPYLINRFQKKEGGMMKEEIL